MPSKRRSIIASALVPAGALAGLTYSRYRRDLRRARERIAAGSEVAYTSFGALEYAVSGEGAPLLSIHGAGGGWDQGMAIARSLGGGFSVVAPSRFGYLRSNVPQDASPAAQADAFRVLLNLVGLERVAVVGASAGALSAVQFALRYPEHCSALLLLSPAGWAPQRRDRKLGLLTGVALSSSFNLWLASKLAPGLLEKLLGSRATKALTSAERESLRAFADGLQPLDARSGGILNDGKNQLRLGPVPLEQIRVPTLIMAAADDPWNTLPAARHLAGHIRGARLVATERGGHLLLGGLDELTREAGAFLRANATSRLLPVQPPSQQPLPRG